MDLIISFLHFFTWSYGNRSQILYEAELLLEEKAEQNIVHWFLMQ